MLEWPLVWILDIVANCLNFMIIHETINIIFIFVINCLIMWYLIQFQIHSCYYIMQNYHLHNNLICLYNHNCNHYLLEVQQCCSHWTL
jgi:hypothetical protein